MLEAPPEPSPKDVAKQRMLRVAWIVVAGGVLVAFGAAVVGGSSPDTNVTLPRQLAGMIMLAGLLVVLAAHRIAWLRSFRQRRDLSTQSGERGETHSMFRFLLLGVPAITGAIVVTWVVLAIVPPLLAGLVIIAVTLLLPVVLLVIAVYGRGCGATFCLGALVPTFARLLGFVTFWFPMSGGPSTLRIIESIGNATSVTGLVWLASLVAGVVAIGTRALVGQGPLPEEHG